MQFNKALSCTLLLLATTAHAAGTWTATGSMNTGRYNHTATRLANGKVLVTGGDNAGATAELYDPNTGIWSNTGSMSTARLGHTATLLPNGKVLVAGGYKDGAIASAELYDPSTGTWSNTGSINTARYIHTATLLPNGKVLVAGGDNSSAVASAELYDPNSGTWSNTGSMNTARWYHIATLLPNGQVLVAGGISNRTVVASAELYDPSTATWNNTGSMKSARVNHTNTLLSNGHVLVTGGEGGGATAELYDPSTSTWNNIATMDAIRDVHTATLLPNGQVLVAGGISDSTVFASAELYDPNTSTWSNTGSMITARWIHTATLLLNGKVLVAGGSNYSYGIYGYLASAELYDPGPTAPTIPSVSTNAPSLITATSAILQGTVNPNGAATNATFDFGTTTNYGTSLTATPATIAATAAATSVSANKTGLICNTTYHYRVKATNSAGTSYSTDKTFITATCPIVTYTVTPTAETGGTVSPSTAQTVNKGATKAFTVAANAGYTKNNAVTGSCPQGSWNGNVWTTGAITANCTVIFAFTPTNTNPNAWLNPPTPSVIVEQPLQLNIIANSSGTKIGFYDFIITYDRNKLAVDFAQCNGDGVCVGNNGWSGFAVYHDITVINGITYGTINVYGMNATGSGPGNDLQLLKVYFKAKFVTGSTPVNLTIQALRSTGGNTIGLIANGATVNISPALCGDADGNGAVNIVDALAVARKVIGLPPPPTIVTTWADVNSDSAVSIVDALHIARYSVGLVLPPEVCKIGQAL